MYNPSLHLHQRIRIAFLAVVGVQQKLTTYLEQTICEMLGYHKLIRNRYRQWPTSTAPVFIWFTGNDLFKEKLVRKPMCEIYPDYRDYFINKQEDDEQARRFIYTKLICSQIFFALTLNSPSDLKCVHFSATRPFDKKAFDELFEIISRAIYQIVYW